MLSAFVLAFTDGANNDDFENRSRTAVLFKSLFFVFMGFVSGGNANAPASVPARVATIGFGFFVSPFPLL